MNNQNKANILCKIVSYIIPITTFGMTIVSLYESNEYLVLYILPVFLILWFLILLINFILIIIKHKEIGAKAIIFNSLSAGVFLWCIFIVLFSGSILLEGFHTT